MSTPPPNEPVGGAPEPEGREPDVDAATAANLAALADGSLDPSLREQALDRAGGSPHLDASLREQRRALALLSEAAEVLAPDSLHARVEQLVEERPSRLWLPRRVSPRGDVAEERAGTGSARSRPRRMPRLASAGLAAAVVAAALAVGLALGLGGSGSPTIGEFTALGSRPPTAGPPAKSPGGASQLDLRVDNIAFPYWEDRFGLTATGVRVDRLGGHTVTTVLYGHPGGASIAYSIVAGAPPSISGLASSAGTAVWHGGVRYWIQTVHGSPTIVWNRSGHRCILTGHGVNALQLLALASWPVKRHLA